jgi:hypothetical protein
MPQFFVGKGVGIGTSPRSRQPASPFALPAASPLTSSLAGFGLGVGFGAGWGFGGTWRACALLARAALRSSGATRTANELRRSFQRSPCTPLTQHSLVGRNAAEPVGAGTRRVVRTIPPQVPPLTRPSPAHITGGGAGIGLGLGWGWGVVRSRAEPGFCHVALTCSVHRGGVARLSTPNRVFREKQRVLKECWRAPPPPLLLPPPQLCRHFSLMPPHQSKAQRGD